RADGAFEAFHDEVRGLLPAEVFEHHDAGEDDGAGVDDVLAGVLGGGAVGGFEDGVAGDVVDVATGGDADAADLRRQRVAEVVAVEVEGGDHVEILGAGEDLLEGDVGDRVLNDEARAGLAVGDLAPGAAVDL